METNIFRFYPSGKTATKHPIHHVLQGTQLEILDIKLISDDEDAHYHLILRTTPDSPEVLEDFLLEVSESGCSLPAGKLDISKFKLELIAVPGEIHLEDRYCIEIEYKTLQ